MVWYSRMGKKVGGSVLKGGRGAVIRKENESFSGGV